jgi:hypothetical protein
MASPVAREKNASPAATVQADGHWVEYDQFIDQQIRKTRGQVKGVEIAAALMTLATGSLIFFLAMALADHWLFPHGMGFWGRLTALGLYLAGAGYYAYRRLLPLVLMSINPVYAAEAIERSKPSLKNGLINFLLLRNQREKVPSAVYEAVEQQAATSLARVPMEGAVDRSRLIQLGYVLLAVVALFSVYFVLSPKNPFATVGRVMLPWAKIDAPTRVAITDIEPGDRTFFRGETVEVSAELHGLRGDEPVQILYSTADRQAVDQPLPMFLSPRGVRHVAKLPSGDGGLQQDIDYRIEAGDAISATYHLEAAIAPTIAVDSIEYEYPTYTGRSRRQVDSAGDIQALEGTRVMIHAHANQAIRTAELELEGEKGLRKLPARIDGQKVTASFTLALDDEDRTKPQFAHYRLRPEGREKPQPVQYRIDVIPDIAPEIKFLAPEKQEAVVPANGRLTLELRALDPDYALSEVKLSGELNRQNVLDQRLLKETHAGPLLSRYVFDPVKLGLKVGDTIEYWATAKDNRTPTPNETQTARRLIRIGSPEARHPRSDQLAQNDSKNGQGDAEKNPQDQDGADNNAQQNGATHRQPKSGEGASNAEHGSDLQHDRANDGHSPRNQNPDTERNPADQQPEGAQDKQPGSQQKQDQGKQPKTGDKQQPGDRGKADQGNSDQQQQDGTDQKNSDQKNSEQKNQDGGKSGDQGGGSSKQGKSGSPQQGKSKGASGDGSSNDQGDSSGQSAAGNPSNSSQSKGQTGGGQGDKSQTNPDQNSAANKNSSQSTSGQPAGDQTKSGDNQSGQKPGDSKAQGSAGDKSQNQQTPAAGAPQRSDQPVANDGSDDAQALKRVAEFEQEHGHQGGYGGFADKHGQNQPQNGTQQKPVQNPNSDDKSGQQGDQQKPDSASGDKPQSGNKSGERSNSGNPQAGKNSAAQQSGADKGGQQGAKQGDKSAGEKQTGDKPAGDKSADNNPAGDKSAQHAGEKSGEKAGDKPSEGSGEQSGDKIPGDKSAADKANRPGPNDKPGSEQQNAGNPSADKQAGDKQTGDNQTGDKQSADKANAGEKQGDKQVADKQGDKQNADSSAGQQKTGDKPNGDGQSNPRQNPQGQNSEQNQPNQSQPGEKSADGTEKSTGSGQKSGDQPPGSKPSDQNSEPGKGTSRGPEPKTDAQRNNANPDAQGKGDKAKSGSQPTDKKPQSDKPNEQRPDAQGGDPDGLKGNSGSGDSSNADDKGTSSTQEGNRPRENKQDHSGPQQPKQSDANNDGSNSPSGSPHESDSTGGQGGDRSGGGEKGPGQSSGKAGTGGAGHNTASEEGSGTAQGQGKGETGDKAGHDKTSDRATGQSGDKAGNGSQTKAPQPGEKNSHPAAPKSADSAGTPSNNSPNGTPSPNGQDTGHAGGASNIPQGGDRAGPIPDSADYAGRKTGDAGNAEFAKKQFDLALEYLKKGNPDLLKDLHWTADDAQRLAARLEQMKKNAQVPGAKGDEARREMDDLLRTLGSRNGLISRHSDQPVDSQRGLRESHDSGPPAEYIEQFDAFQQGALRGGK